MGRPPILVGEAPGGSLTLDAPRPVGEDGLFWHSLHLTGAVGRRMAAMAAIPWLEYLRDTRRTNLFYEPQAGKRWDRHAAVDRAREIAIGLDEDDRVVALGTKVAAAFGIAHVPTYTWVELDPESPGWAAIARVPHPSGRNRLLNDDAERERLGRFLREAIQG